VSGVGRMREACMSLRGTQSAKWLFWRLSHQ
jgi:hypothetical protein